MNIAAQLVGLKVSSVEKRDYTDFFHFTSGDRAQTEGPWRLIRDGRVEVTSEDHGQKFGLPAPVDAAAAAGEALLGQMVETAEIQKNTGDLVLRFKGGTELQLLQMSGGHESWQLYLNGAQIICTGGGDIAIMQKVV